MTRLRWRTAATVALVPAALVLVSCSTPARRIDNNRALFETFPAKAQEQIRQGIVDLGFTKEMVRMAAGPPDRTYLRRAADGTTETWAYLGLYVSPGPPRWARPYFIYRDRCGRPRYVSRSFALDTDDWEDHRYERIRIEFKDGRVHAIETVDY